jgi:hypothetical protein
MQRFFLLILCFAVLGAACTSELPTAPRQPPATTPSQPPAPRPFTFAEQYTEIVVGEVVRRLVTSENPECTDEPGWKCQYFRLTAPIDGTLEVMTIVWRGTVLQGVDFSLDESGGWKWWSPTSGQPRDGEPWPPLRVPVKGGTTYQITVWYVTPGVEFEIRSSMQPN